MSPRLKFEREFLRLAYTWLKCRWRVIQGDRLINCPIPFDLAYDLLGCNDSLYEMRLICREQLDG